MTSQVVTVSINGRFFGRPITGVERVATELVRALSARAAQGDGEWTSPSGRRFRFRILVPNGVDVPAGFEALERLTVGSRHGHLWEQLDLPRASRETFLLNFCNTAPLFKRDQLVFLHDAGVFRTPKAYRPAFRWWYRAMFLVVARRAAALVTNSSFSQAELADRCRVPAQRFAVLPLGHEHALVQPADRSVFERHAIPSSGFVLGVSSQNPNKNFPMLLRAVKLLSKGAGVPPVVIAGGMNPKVFGAGDLEGSHASFIGPVNDAELAALFEGAACLVYPSVYEGFGLPPLEAMARGCPVVASRAPALL
jgi:glycosyltransferase involved in cell wall biosynthesis